MMFLLASGLKTSAKGFLAIWLSLLKVYCLGSTKYTRYVNWHSKTYINPPCQPWCKNTDTQPLADGLPNEQVIFNLLLFEYIVIPLSLGRYSIIYKVQLSLSYMLSITLSISY